MVRKTIITLSAAVLLSSAVACSGQFDTEIDALLERIEALKQEDARTRELVEKEIDRLCRDILAQLDALEEDVLDHLDETVARVEDEILSRMMQVRRTIRAGSAKVGAELDEWHGRMKAATDRMVRQLDDARALMQAEQEKAIAYSYKEYAERLSAAQSQIDWLEANLSGLVDRTAARMERLNSLEEDFAVAHEQMMELKRRKDEMLALIGQYEGEIQKVIGANLKEMEDRDLSAFSNQLYDSYVKLELLRDEILSATDEVADLYSEMPVIESLLDEAEDLVDLMYDIEDLCDDFDLSQIELVIDQLAMAYDAACDCPYDIDDLESNIDDLQSWLDDFLSGAEAAQDLLHNEGWDDVDEALSIIEDAISDLT